MRERLIEYLLLPVLLIVLIGLPFLLGVFLDPIVQPFIDDHEVRIYAVLTVGAVWWIVRSYHEATMLKFEHLRRQIASLETAIGNLEVRHNG